MWLTQSFKPYQYTKDNPQSKPSFKLKAAKANVIEVLGYVIVLFSSIGFLTFLSPWLLTEGLILLHKAQRSMTAVATVEQASLDVTPAPTLAPPPEPTIDPATLPFRIFIPKIKVESKVISNVDMSDQAAYTVALKEGVAHALDTAFPGQGKMVYIFGHSTDYAWNVATYNALFYELKELEVGDEVSLRLGETQYQYQVIDKMIIEANDIKFIQDLSDQNILVLQTCYPPGTTWKRLLVLAQPI